ncbi:MAG: non-canonical purine NTP pyrophosphatase, partial [SAR202 cluster bacterium]|nr:non-canonical purine NTP pyrophosphatase [SAR202 cluster bacterium]
FGYDPIFISSIFQKTNAQLKDEEKDSISHRGLAIKKITPLLEKMLI